MRIEAQIKKGFQTVSEITPITTNQKVPDEFWTREFILYENNKVSKVNFSHLKGKPIILDFWSVHCGACIAGFPFLKEMMGKYEERLYILPVYSKKSGDPEEIERTFSMMDPKYRFSRSVLFDDYLQYLFPHGPIPYYVWIDKMGRVMAVTNSGLMSEDNLLKLINRYEKHK